ISSKNCSGDYSLIGPGSPNLNKDTVGFYHDSIRDCNLSERRESQIKLCQQPKDTYEVFAQYCSIMPPASVLRYLGVPVQPEQPGTCSVFQYNRNSPEHAQDGGQHMTTLRKRRVPESITGLCGEPVVEVEQPAQLLAALDRRVLAGWSRWLFGWCEHQSSGSASAG